MKSFKFILKKHSLKDYIELSYTVSGLLYIYKQDGLSSKETYQALTKLYKEFWVKATCIGVHYEII